MKRLWVILVWLPVFAAETVADRYIVELTGAPAVIQAQRAGRGAFESARTRVRSAQQQVRRSVETAGATVLNQVDTVANALVVQATAEQAAALASQPGVQRVVPVRRFHKLLDHALPLHKVPEAWSRVGLENAGAGIKIAIIDSGIDITHPAFDDPSLLYPKASPR